MTWRETAGVQQVPVQREGIRAGNSHPPVITLPGNPVDMERRRFITALGTAGAATLAGCIGGGDDVANGTADDTDNGGTRPVTSAIRGRSSSRSWPLQQSRTSTRRLPSSIPLTRFTPAISMTRWSSSALSGT